MFAKSCFGGSFGRRSRKNKDDENSGGGSGSRSNRRRSGDNDSDGDDHDQDDHPLLWSRDLEKHFLGEFSFAVFQANTVLEDRSQVEVGRNATFVGVYDGHGGPEAARYIDSHLFNNFIANLQDRENTSEDVINKAFAATEDGFLALVTNTRHLKPMMAAIGSCCLVGVILNGTLHVANVGDSRAVIASLGPSNTVVAEQLNMEHNASKEEIRRELYAAHPDDKTIVEFKQGIWRIKGIIQVSRSIGDAYLKNPDMAMDSSYSRFYISNPIQRAVLKAEPTIRTRVLQPNDKFLIFASDGLWEHFSNEEVVNIVHSSPRLGIAKRLVNKALKRAATRMKVRYEDMKNVDKGDRRKYHDDITVVVIFLDHGLLNEEERNQPIPELSVHGFNDTIEPSKFSTLQQTT